MKPISPIDASFHKLVDICDQAEKLSTLTYEDCVNINEIICRLRSDLAASEQVSQYYRKFHKSVANALQKLEDSGE